MAWTWNTDGFWIITGGLLKQVITKGKCEYDIARVLISIKIRGMVGATKGCWEDSVRKVRKTQRVMSQKLGEKDSLI